MGAKTVWLSKIFKISHFYVQRFVTTWESSTGSIIDIIDYKWLIKKTHNNCSRFFFFKKLCIYVFFYHIFFSTGIEKNVDCHWGKTPWYLVFSVVL